ncbi:hypothetical protein DERF_008684 [Dermatophagoides farinae]|uniref:Uncharacterized protein n=1 Tax=Dermatophagoides farinae TaxID=6954 RepID=A0A922L780_DERFA|nr:hypothetical protein DERF_008684 [Dermatophagoides farinae]
MAPSNRKVQFRLENVKEELEDENQQSCNNDNKRGPIAITKRPAFELPTSHNQQNDPLTIKEQYRPDLKRLSLDDLKGLIEKQQRILRNRKLLDNLKDKGEKTKKFLQEIQEELSIREKNVNKSIAKTEHFVRRIVHKRRKR